MKGDEFYQKVAMALTGCQLVEQELKLYITEALLLVDKFIENRMTFNMRGEDYKDSAMETLIKNFKKLNANKELIGELNKFKDERNYLTHKAISGCIDPDGEVSSQDLNNLLVCLDNIQNEAKRLRDQINEEANKFRGHLYFDQIDDEIN